MTGVRIRPLIAAAATVAAVSLGTAAPAAADELQFLGALTAVGIQVYDADMALNTGYAICGALNTTNGADVASNLYRVTGWDVPNMAVASAWVVISAKTLCPWHDHTDQQSNRQQLV